MALGCALRDGRGCEQSYEGAVKWFDLAGQQVTGPVGVNLIYKSLPMPYF